jgi:hypothetical protein
LYVDGAEVVADAVPQPGLEGAEGGLLFGVSSSFATGTFFFGLMDDIRVYNVALSAEEVAKLVQ